MIGIFQICSWLLTHVSRYLASFDVEFLLSCLAQDVSILILLFLFLFAFQQHSLRLIVQVVGVKHVVVDVIIKCHLQIK